MKINTWNEERKGDHVKFVASWVDRMRRPGGVQIAVTKNIQPLAIPTLIEGDAACVNDTINQIAWIAWQRGWRPAGLFEAVVSVINRFGLRT